MEDNKTKSYRSAVEFKRLHDGVQLPERKTGGSAGYDLYVPDNVVIEPGRNIVKMGFAMAMPHGMYARIKARSGFSVKGFYDDDGCGRYDADVIEGTVDSDYRGEVGVIVKSFEKIPFMVKKGTRIAQMIFSRYLTPLVAEVEQLSTTGRVGGFGSTGVK